MRDLVFLVPDKNTEHTVRGAVQRFDSLGIRRIEYTIIADPGRDGGVRRRGAQTLRAVRGRFAHAVMILDYEGSGAETATPSAEQLEARLDTQLAADWGVNGKAIVVDPEVDVWMWGAESHIRREVSWRDQAGIREWLVQRGFEFSGSKPRRPKEALEAVFQHAGVPRSSAHYQAIALWVSLAKCEDRAFQRLRVCLSSWFGR